jgi:hypothetical protein
VAIDDAVTRDATAALATPPGSTRHPKAACALAALRHAACATAASATVTKW